jgi:sulfoxide reductase heme-binding subunit YedZ
VHLTSSPLDWYAARAAGIAAYLLLTGVVLIGLTMAGRKKLDRWPRLALEDVHRFGGLLVGSFISIHVVTIAIDAWLPFPLQSLLIPFLSLYRPIWVGLGIVAAELLLALAVTNHYRRRMRYRVWRRAHYLNFAVWSAATLHGVGSGTDRSSHWALALYAAAGSSVVAATVWRLTRRRFAAPRALPAAGVAAAAVTLLIVGLGAGPLKFEPKPWNAASFHERLTGRVARIAGETRVIVAMTGEGSGTQHVLVRADLLLEPKRIAKTAFQMEYLPSGYRCIGTVTSVHGVKVKKGYGFSFSAVCHLADGARRVVTARWRGGGAVFRASALGSTRQSILGFAGSAEIADGVVTSHA